MKMTAAYLLIVYSFNEGVPPPHGEMTVSSMPSEEVCRKVGEAKVKIDYSVGQRAGVKSVWFECRKATGVGEP